MSHYFELVEGDHKWCEFEETEEAIAYFKVLSRYPFENTEKDHDKLQNSR
jgi:hypothetical protein